MQAIRRSVVALTLLVLCSMSSLAQTGTTGTITVLVQDPTGAIVPDAALELRDKGTNALRSGATQQSGTYTFPNLPFGVYELTVNAKGFQREIYESVQVQTGRATEIRAMLKIGASAETVQVNASEAPLVETTSTTLAT